jgi:protein SCO1/2
MMKGTTLFILLSFLAACQQKNKDINVLSQKETLPYYISADFTPHWFKKDDLPDTIHCIPSFSFIDQNGKPVTEKNVENKIYVADFFFTSCPGICPKLTKNLFVVQEAFKDDPEIILLSHSVTPGKDDPGVLKKYALIHGVIDNKWFLLTGNRDSIYTIARKSYFADEDLGLQQGVNDFLHTENVFLIDKKGRIRGIYKGTLPSEMENMIADIKLLKTEKE